jgi:maltose O-acetyltransferase
LTKSGKEKMLVWIGYGSTICPGVNIGSTSVIGAGSVVTEDILEDVFAGGNPCKGTRKLKSEETRI